MNCPHCPGHFIELEVTAETFARWRRIAIEEQIRHLDSSLRGYAKTDEDRKTSKMGADHWAMVDGRASVTRSQRDYLYSLWVAETPAPPVITGQLDLLGGVAS